MYVAPVDSEIIRGDECMNLMKEYRNKFGESFNPFNYADYHRRGENAAAVFYVEALKEAVSKDVPTRVKTERYDFFDH